MDNPFALIVLAAQKALLRDRIPEQELGEQRLTVARALIQSHKYSHEQIINFLYFLKNFIYIENPVINRNFDREIEVLTGKENAMGIIETIKKITREEAILEERKKRKLEMAKRNQEIAKNLKKAGVDLNIIAKSTGLSVEDIRKLWICSNFFPQLLLLCRISWILPTKWRGFVFYSILFYPQYYRFTPDFDQKIYPLNNREVSTQRWNTSKTNEFS